MSWLTIVREYRNCKRDNLSEKAKEELVAQGAVTLSERMLAQLAEEGNTANTRQLQVGRWG